MQKTALFPIISFRRYYTGLVMSSYGKRYLFTECPLDIYSAIAPYSSTCGLGSPLNLKCQHDKFGVSIRLAAICYGFEVVCGHYTRGTAERSVAKSALSLSGYRISASISFPNSIHFCSKDSNPEITFSVS